MKLKDKLILHANTSHSLPTALESEMYVLGSVMLLEGAVQSVFEHIRHWHFYFDKNVVIWKAVTRLIKKDKSITKDLLFMELHKKAYFEGEIEAGYLQQCIDKCGKGSEIVSAGVLRCHKEEMIDTWSRRQMIDLGHTIQYWGFLPGIQENAISNDENVYEFDPNDAIEMPDYTLTLDIEGKQYGLAEQGCIVHISGGTGVRKTTLLTALIASSFRERMIGFKFERRGIILFFDTEQPKKRFKHVQRRIHNMCGRKNTKQYYRSFSLRKLSPMERIKFIEKTIRRFSKKGPIASIVIDGTLDLVNSMNDVKECTYAMQKIMTWTDEYNFIAFCVLHDTSTNSNKMGGWLGSISERKQDTEMNLTFAEDPDYSEITFRKTRGTRKPRSFEFTQDANGWPVLAPIAQKNNDYYEDVPF
jgi:hypothetical protein